MSVVNFRLHRIVETPDGVFRPPPFRFEAGMLALALLIVAAAWSIGRLSMPTALLHLAILLVALAFRAFEYRRVGPFGRPCVAVSGDLLVFALPNDTRREFRFPLDDLRRLHVYGLAGRRIYRCVHRDGTYAEAIPQWEFDIEQAVIRFLQRALGTRVIVEEPQTLFASIRGDGPEMPDGA